jgi:pimeloyl-ACP methyl ester carboxylesterase
MLSAPEKGFYKIPDAAHSPLWENPEETCKVLKEIKKLNQN